MATYPASLDAFTNPTPTSTLASPAHSAQHSLANDAILAIETELGTLPKGSAASVKARLDAMDTAMLSVATPTNLLWDDIRVSVNRATTGTNAPTLTTHRDSLMSYAFSATVMQQLYFDVQLPHAWAAGTIIKPHIHWSPGNSTNTGNVVWRLEYSWANMGAAFPASTTTTVVAGTQAASGTPYQQHVLGLPDIDGTGKTVSSVIMCRIFREAADAADTFTGVAHAISVDFHIQTNSGGGAVLP